MNKVNYYVVLPFFIALFIALFFLFPRNPANGASLDNIPTVLAPLTLVREHNLDFNEFVEGKEKLSPDPNINGEIYYFVLNSNHKVIANFPILNGILLTPFYFIFSLFVPHLWEINTFFNATLIDIVFFVSTLVTVATSYVLFNLIYSKFNSLKIALLCIVLFVFGTPVISISSRFVWQHTFSLFFIALLLSAFERKKYYYVILFSVLTTLSRPPALLICVPFLCMSLISIYRKKIKRINIIDICALVISFLLIWTQLFYSFYYFHDLFTIAPQYTLSRFSGNIVEGITGLLFSPSKGLFFYSPIFLFSFFFLFKQLRKKQNSVYILYLVAIFLYIFIISAWDAWYGGWSLGYRLLLETTPLLVLLLADFLHNHHFQLDTTSLLIALTIGISILFNTQMNANFGDCNFNRYPKDIDILRGTQKTQRLWLDSPIFRCVTQLEDRGKYNYFDTTSK